MSQFVPDVTAIDAMITPLRTRELKLYIFFLFWIYNYFQLKYDAMKIFPDNFIYFL